MPRVSEQHRAARRDQILAAAVRCMAKDGFHKTTMADVIREAGLSAGAVYIYFPSKDDLIRALAHRSIGRVARVLEGMRDRSPAIRPDVALQEALEELMAAAGEQQEDLLRVGVQAWGEALRDPTVHETVTGEMRALRDGLAVLVRRAQQDGTVDPGADPGQVASLLTGTIPGYVLQRLLLQDITPASYVAGLRGLLSPLRDRDGGH